MASLIRQSHATNDTPLWLGTNGGTINGSLTVNGSINTTPAGLGGITAGGFTVTNTSNTIALRMGYNGNNGVIACQGGGGNIKFTQLGSAGNTTFTPSAFGAGLDNFTIQGIVSASRVATNSLELLDVGANAIVGTSTLVAGSSPVIVTGACLGPQSKIFLTRTDINASTSLGMLRVRQRNAGNFLVEACGPSPANVVDLGDVSSFDWMIINS